MRVDVRNLKEIRKYLEKFPDEMFKDAKDIMRQGMFDAREKIHKNCEDKLKVRSGMLRRSIQFGIFGNKLDSLKASVFSAANVGGQEVLYAPVHEFGATIKAKKAYARVPGGPYLNIPASENKTPSGVIRMKAREVFAQGGYIRRFRSGGYGVFLPGNRLMFTLKKQVKIPPRLGMVETCENQIPTILSNLVNALGDY